MEEGGETGRLFIVRSGITFARENMAKACHVTLDIQLTSRRLVLGGKCLPYFANWNSLSRRRISVPPPASFLSIARCACAAAAGKMTGPACVRMRRVCVGCGRRLYVDGAHIYCNNARENENGQLTWMVGPNWKPYSRHL